jgi:hypothetical protein
MTASERTSTAKSVRRTVAVVALPQRAQMFRLQGCRRSAQQVDSRHHASSVPGSSAQQRPRTGNYGFMFD